MRLEKAKEHYLARLRREWEEDAEIMNYDDGADLEASSPESTEHVAKSEHIQIFFPSLGEVILCLQIFHFEMIQSMTVL